MVYTSTRPKSGDIVLGVAGARTKVLLDTTRRDANKNAAEIMADFIELKKWGYNRPNYKIEGNIIFVSEWALGQVIGKKGHIIKAIKEMYGFVKILPMPYEEDDKYCFIKEYITENGYIAELKKPNSWFRKRLNKGNSGLYTVLVSQKTGDFFSEDSAIFDKVLCKELEELGGIAKNPVLFEADINIELYTKLYICERFGGDIYCLEEDLHLLKFFGYDKSDFKIYDVSLIIKEKIEKFLEHVEGGDFYRAPANNLFYWLKKDGVKFLKEYSFTTRRRTC